MASPELFPDPRAAARAAQTLQPDGEGHLLRCPPVSAKDQRGGPSGSLSLALPGPAPSGVVRATSTGLLVPLLCSLVSSYPSTPSHPPAENASSRVSSVDVQFVL